MDKVTAEIVREKTGPASLLGDSNDAAPGQHEATEEARRAIKKHSTHS